MARLALLAVPVIALLAGYLMALEAHCAIRAKINDCHRTLIVKKEEREAFCAH